MNETNDAKVINYLTECLKVINNENLPFITIHYVFQNEDISSLFSSSVWDRSQLALACAVKILRIDTVGLISIEDAKNIFTFAIGLLQKK